MPADIPGMVSHWSDGNPDCRTRQRRATRPPPVGSSLPRQDTFESSEHDSVHGLDPGSIAFYYGSVEGITLKTYELIDIGADGKRSGQIPIAFPKHLRRHPTMSLSVHGVVMPQVSIDELRRCASAERPARASFCPHDVRRL